jgi:hypothetical protein
MLAVSAPSAAGFSPLFSGEFGEKRNRGGPVGLFAITLVSRTDRHLVDNVSNQPGDGE